MVGVSGPLLAYTPNEGRRFLLGLTLAGLAGSATLGLLGLGLSLVLRQVLSSSTRVVLLIIWAVLLGVADLANRPPQWFRQVPQQLVRELKPGFLGSVWGFDLGLLVTTKKVTSLMWLAIGGVVLLRPSLVPLYVMALGLTTSLSIVFWSLQVKGDTTCLMRRRRDWRTRIRWFSGAAMLALAILAVGQAVA